MGLTNVATAGGDAIATLTAGLVLDSFNRVQPLLGYPAVFVLMMVYFSLSALALTRIPVGPGARAAERQARPPRAPAAFHDVVGDGPVVVPGGGDAEGVSLPGQEDADSPLVEAPLHVQGRPPGDPDASRAARAHGRPIPFDRDSPHLTRDRPA